MRKKRLPVSLRNIGVMLAVLAALGLYMSVASAALPQSASHVTLNWLSNVGQGVVGPACHSTTCTSAPNICGMVGTGTYDPDHTNLASCTAVTPPDSDCTPCTTANNSCGMHNSGYIVGGVCNVSKTVTYTSGSGTWTVPDNTATVVAEVWGGGGGGGTGYSGSSNDAGGGGGGGAGYAKKTISSPAASYSYSVGGGGAPAAGGGATSFGGFLTATGGAAGGNGVGDSHGGYGGAGGSGSGGDVAGTGTTGNTGEYGFTAGGGTGGAAPSGGVGGGGAPRANGSSATAGAVPGGGGGGGYGGWTPGGSPAGSGASGASGEVRITYTPVDPLPDSACPAPTATLSASPSTIDSGQSSTLTWSSTNATSCTAAGGFSTGGATSGSASTGALTSTQNYQISCTGTKGTTSSNVATVTVRQPTVSISGSPDRIPRGGTTTITWSATNVNSCTITKNGTTWKTLTADASRTVSGNASDTLTQQTTYVISCANDAGTGVVGASATAIINIASSFQEF